MTEEESTPVEIAKPPSAMMVDSALVRTIKDRRNINVGACYQCMKCSTGCPLSFTMELLPHQVMKAVQLGLPEEIFKANTCWICASCYTCSVRCPNDINIAGVMDYFRQESEGRELPRSEEDVRAFHRSFLKSVRRHGRASELGIVLLFKDMGLGMRMFGKGKLKILPKNIKGRKEVRELFDKRKKETQP
jgi:heterodisulfide reductase subunit C